jgi:tRNA 5-methylaminomethyl-2-thiouridine biosynthesis bifunctional protein
VTSKALTPARLRIEAEAANKTNKSPPYAPDFDDVYHPAEGAWEQAQHVFLGGNGLPQRWQGRQRFVILETGFGLGNNFLATWAAWRADPKRCERLVFISIEKHPLTLEDLTRVHAQRHVDADHAQAQALAERLLQAWPPLTAGMHVLDFDEPSQQGLTLMLAFGDVREWLPQLMARVDAFYLDGFSPAKNPDMWHSHWLSRLNRLAAPDATVATWSVARPARDALNQAGFVVHKQAGFTGKRDMLCGRYAPWHQPQAPAGGMWPEPETQHHAIVIGGGLAGCASAWALCQAGWHVTLLEQHSEIATEASGNDGGLFHSLVHATDNLHTRLYRNAALMTHALLKPWVDSGAVAGQCKGLLRIDERFTEAQAQAQLASLGWPSTHLNWLTQAQACAQSGLPLPHGAWQFLQGGWISPVAYAKQLLEVAKAQGRLTVMLNARVAQLEPSSTSATVWHARDDKGHVLASASTVVLCNAAQLPALLSAAPFGLTQEALPMQLVRGQTSLLPANLAGLQRPALPVGGHGYGLTLPDGRVLCGATANADDMHPHMRQADHVLNLQQALGLGVLPAMPDVNNIALAGRVGWRVNTPDRLPLVGALPRLVTPSAKAGQHIRHMPRWRNAHGGVYVVGALGSRGITWAALCGRLISHWVCSTPCPLEADLRDALDPARFLVRAQRQAEALAAAPDTAWGSGLGP